MEQQIRETAILICKRADRTGKLHYYRKSANHIYRDDKDCVSVYLHADRAVRCERIQKRDQISEREALKMIQEVDEKRAAFQEQCTSTKWGDGNEYDLCINTGIIGIEYAVEMILEYIRFENIL